MGVFNGSAGMVNSIDGIRRPGANLIIQPLLFFSSDPAVFFSSLPPGFFFSEPVTPAA